LSQTTPQSPWPSGQTTFEWLKKDSAMKFIDNIYTTKQETLFDDVTAALKKASVNLARNDSAGTLSWSKYKNPTVYHLLKEALPAFARTGLNVGGNGDIINAITHSHGPSWRMIVQLSSPAIAYGVYPGGQSGNPGSKFYDNYLDKWAAGQYNKLWFMRAGDQTDSQIKWTMKFSKG